MNHKLPPIPLKIHSQFVQFLDFATENKDQIPGEIRELVQVLQRRLQKYPVATAEVAMGGTMEQSISDITQVETAQFADASQEGLPTSLADMPQTAEIAVDNANHHQVKNLESKTEMVVVGEQAGSDNYNDRLAWASQEISRFRKTQADRGDLTEEISQFMESLEKSLSVSSDFALYEAGRKGARQQQQPLRQPQQLPPGYISAPPVSSMKFPATRPVPNERKPAHHAVHHHTMSQSTSSRWWAVVLCCSIVLGYLIAMLSQRYAKPSPDTTAKTAPPSTTIAPVSTTQSQQQPQPPVKADPELPPQPTTVVTEVERVLVEHPDEQELAARLLVWKKQASCTAKDIPLLSQLYEQYDNKPQIAALITLIIQQMHAVEAQDWLNQKMAQLPSNKIALSEQLLQMDAEKGKAIVLNFLQKEIHSPICLKLIQMLAAQYPEDKQVCDEIIARFRRIPDETLRSDLLALLTRLNTEPTFFSGVVADKHYALTTRLNALDAILNYFNSNKHATRSTRYQMIFELNEIADNAEDVLERKIGEVVQYLSNKD